MKQGRREQDGKGLWTFAYAAEAIGVETSAAVWLARRGRIMTKRVGSRTYVVPQSVAGYATARGICLRRPVDRAQKLAMVYARLTWPEYLTAAYARHELFEIGRSVQGLADEVGVREVHMRRRLTELGVEVPVNWKTRQVWPPEMNGVSVSVLPALIRALDRCAQPPTTLEEAQPWVERWQAKQRKAIPGPLGELEARWITPEEILSIVRTQHIRTGRRVVVSEVVR